MAKIKIITDSTADIPKNLAEELNITVVPLTVHFGEESYKDWYDLTSTEFFEKLKNSDVMPTTSQISPAAFEEVFRKELQENDSIICVTLSSKASGTYQSAVIAKNSIEDADIEVIDSMLLSYGYGMVVVEAAKMAKEGKSKQEIIGRVNYLLERIDTYFIVDTLEYLKKGGRINLAAAVIGNILNIKPVLGIKDGLVVPVDKIRGSKNIIPKMVELIKSKGYNMSNQVVGLAHGAIPDRLEELKEAIENEFHPKGFVISEVGSVIGAHSGPGVIGAFFIRD
ncbi:MAG: fatty acid kinase fatty acid binding subunit [Petroclostridium sp.]|jgi:DegV family protein with EDD domain|uniref:DegV family protein n=1 Tax=Petroclostridium xylanilyticum TaxID=1792311 RepID=UPI000B97E28E|nr:DegV family protein [Petroclostridium xylanilyticum]MDK2810026.1 fatty acid kinase fatty acid binding subunit [Petroclostridium sp.]